MPPSDLHLVVLDERLGGIGLAVRSILDVESAESPLQSVLSAPGVIGSLSLGGIATEVLDVSLVRP